MSSSILVWGVEGGGDVASLHNVHINTNISLVVLCKEVPNSCTFQVQGGIVHEIVPYHNNSFHVQEIWNFLR